MFERFTESARQVIVFAQTEMAALRHEAIASEHILLGLVLVGTGDAADLLASAGVGPDATRAAVLDIVGEGQRETGRGQVPLSADAKATLEGAMLHSEQRGRGNSPIGTAHLLLALLDLRDGTVAQIFTRLGADTGLLRSDTERELSGLRLPDASRLPSLPIGLTPRAKRIWDAAAAGAREDGRSRIAPGDLLEPLLGEPLIASLLAGIGYETATFLSSSATWPGQNPTRSTKRRGRTGGNVIANNSKYC